MRHSKTNYSRFTSRILMFALLLLSFSTTASAHEKPKETPVEVKYLGSNADQLLLQIEFENRDEEDVVVTLKNGEGFPIYTERFRDKKFAKKFQINAAAADASFTLVLATKKERQTQSFQINRNTRIVEDVSITKVR